MPKHPFHVRSLSLILAATVLGLVAAPADAQDLTVRRALPTGQAAFIEVAGPLAARLEPMEVLRRYGGLFGISDPDRELAAARVERDVLGYRHTTFQQYYQGVAVFSGVLKVHQDLAGAITVVNGHYRLIGSALSPEPTLPQEEAVYVAENALAQGPMKVEEIELVVVDPGWYGDPAIGARLAYYVILSDWSIPVREAFFVDAHRGTLLDRWNVLHTARDRQVHDAGGTSTLPGSLIRSEGGSAVGSPPEADEVYDYAGDTYDYFDRGFARDSLNNSGLALVLTVNWFSAVICPNAGWRPDLLQMYFCDDLVTDDVTGHELAHGLTQHTAGLIYQNESGQLNESFSDVFGELVDLYNGDAAFAGPPGGPPSWPTHPSGPGTDSPNGLRTACSSSPGYADGVRWLVGEDLTTFGPIRDMWDPTCFGHPDRATSTLQECNPWDAGGVHTGSGIPNHAFAIVTDGKTFNGQTVTGIGPIKAAAVWYRALTVYLTPASGFGDAYAALNQAAADLVGTTIDDPRPGGTPVLFTAADSLEVDKALQAVEMNLPGSTSCRGACCDSTAGTCQDDVTDAACDGFHSPGRLCASLSPSCAAPGASAMMLVLLDRTGSMIAIRSSTGNTRCDDALEQSKQDVTDFLSGQPGRAAAVWSFAGSGPTQETAGFVNEATALAALSTFDGIGCTDVTPLAESICEAVDFFPPGMSTTDRVIAVNTDGGENVSDGECGPSISSNTFPPPPGNYEVGSWQKKVWDKVQGNAVVLIRNWDTFGGVPLVDPETGGIAEPAPNDNLFFQDVAGSTGGSFMAVDDNGPLPPSFPLPPQGQALLEVPTASAWGLLLLGLLLAGAGALWVRRL